LTFSNEIEIIDLASNTSVCPRIANFPVRLMDPYAGLGYGNEPMICGGTDHTNSIRRDCHRYLNGVWRTYIFGMPVLKHRGSFFSNPNEIGDGKIIVSGGRYIFTALN